MSKTLYRKILLPLMEKMRHTHGHKYLEELEKTQWYADSELRAMQEETLRELVRHAYEKSTFYRRIFDERKMKPGDVKRVEDLQKLPIITKKDLCKNFGDVVSDDMGERVYRRVSTGGSTGEPLAYLLENSAISMAWACNWRAWRCAGWDFGDRMATLAGASLFISRAEDLTGKLKKWAYFRFLQRNQPLSAFDMSDHTMRVYAAKINKHKSRFLRGYASALSELARWCSIDRSGIHFEGVFSTAEYLFAEQRSIIEETFNCKVFDHYGANDGGGIAHECERHEGLHWASENAILEIVDDEGNPFVFGKIKVGDCYIVAQASHQLKLGEKLDELVLVVLDNIIEEFTKIINRDTKTVSENHKVPLKKRLINKIISIVKKRKP